MRDLDPQLDRLREVEAKIMVLAVRLEEAEELVQCLDRNDRLRPVHDGHRRALVDALETLRWHREVILKQMQPLTA